MMRFRRRFLLEVLLVTAVFPGLLVADGLVLNDGRRVGGEMVDMGDAWQVKTAGGVETIQKSDVNRVVRDPAELTVEGDVCRKFAADVLKQAESLKDFPNDRKRKIGSALEFLEKALSLYKDARAFFPGTDHASLDATIVEIEKEVKACRELLPSSKPPEPEPPPPAPEPKPEPPKPPDPPEVPKPEPKPEPPPPPPPPAPKPKPKPKEPPPFAEPNLKSSAGRLMRDIRKAIKDGKPDDAFSMCNRMLRTFPDAPEAVEAQWHVETLKHPDGRLVCGFDRREDLKAWRLHGISKSQMTFSFSQNRMELKEGAGTCHLTFPPAPSDSKAALILELDGFDGARFQGLALWIFQPIPSPGELEVAFVPAGTKALAWVRKIGSARPLNACLAARVPLKFTGWRKVSIPSSEFKLRGRSLEWKDVGALVLYDCKREGVGVILDGLRFLEEP